MLEILIERNVVVGGLAEGILRYFNELHRNRFFGTVHMDFRNGQLVLLTTEQKFKPADFAKVVEK